MAVDVEAGGGARLHVVDRAHAERQARARAIGSRCSIFSITLRRSGATSDGTGRRSNTSSKKPEHDEPLRFLGRHAAGGEVVELVVVDRTDGARVRALHVVGLDLEVGDRLRLRALGEHEVAVGLERHRLLGVAPDADEARVHRLRGVLDRALEQEVAPRVGRVVVLQGAEVEHLVAVAEVDRREVGLGARSREQRLAAEARVGAAQRDHRRPERRVPAEVRALQRDLPRAGAVLLHREVADVRVVADDQLDDRVDEVTGGADPGVGGAVAVEHRDLGAVFGHDQRVREAGEPVALRPVEHHDRLVDDDAARHLHERAAGEEGVVQHGERVGRRVGAHAERRRDLVGVARGEAAHPHALGLELGSSAWCTTRPLRTTTSPTARPPRPPPGRHRAPARRPARPAARPAPAGSGRGRARRSGCSARSPRPRSATRGRRAARPRRRAGPPASRGPGVRAPLRE